MFPYNIFDAIAAIDPTWLTFALAFILLDIISGICKACSKHDIRSDAMKAGFWHKLGIITALVVAGLVDAAAGAGLDLGFQVPIFEAACGYVVLMELFSILENISEINPELAGSKLFQLFATNGEPQLVHAMPSETVTDLEDMPEQADEGDE